MYYQAYNNKNMTDHIKQLHEKGKIIEWLIDGAGIHCLPIQYAGVLTKERICELYNVEPSYFNKPLFING